MICLHCGAEIDDNFVYCSKCGKLTKETNKKENIETQNYNLSTTNKIAEEKNENNYIYHNNSEIKHGDLIQVIDNRRNKVIAQGEVRFIKNNYYSQTLNKEDRFTKDKFLLSVDNKYFFKLDDANYTVKKLQVFIDEDFIRQTYSLGHWSRYRKLDHNNTNVYVENTFLELDKEVKNIVHTLNCFSPYMSTSGSCSGHGTSPAWIVLNFKKPQTLNDFMDILEPYINKIDLSTSKTVASKKAMFRGKPFFSRDIVMRLTTKEIGEPAYKILNDFDKYLTSIIRMNNRQNDILDQLITKKKMQLSNK